MTATSVSQNSYYIGINVANVLYGVELLLYFKTIKILLTNRGARKKSNLFYAFFSSAMLFFVTLWVVTDAVFGYNMWLLHSDYPGGPDAYWHDQVANWYMNWGMTASILLQFMTDALMIYRCWVVWDYSKGIVIPIILWLATFALGLAFDSFICSPEGDLFSGLTKKLGLAYYTVSIFLNITLTCSICYNIMQHAKRIRKYIGQEHASLYFTAITIMIESVFPYTASGVAFMVSLGVAGALSSAFLCVHVLMMCISPQMLILRVIMGRALDRDTVRQPVSTVKFDHGTMMGSQPFESRETRVHLRTLSKVYLPGDGYNKV